MSEIKGEEEFDYPGLLCSLHSLHLYQIMVNSEISNFKREFTFTFSILSSAATKAIFKNKSHRISWFGGLFRIRRSLANRFRTNHPQDQNTTKYCRSITRVRISLLLTYPYLLSANLYPAFCICYRRKRSPNCRWQNPKLFDQFEFYPGCQNQAFGDPRYIRLHSGACNNLHPGRQHWGLIGLPFSRLLPADYSGGLIFLLFFNFWIKTIYLIEILLFFRRS